MARFSPTVASSNFGHNTPGISRRSRPSSVGTHCFVRVTPGRFSTFAFLEPARRFIKEDFPTFGIPTIMAFNLLPSIPLSRYLSIFWPGLFSLILCTDARKPGIVHWRAILPQSPPMEPSSGQQSSERAGIRTRSRPAPCIPSGRAGRRRRRFRKRGRDIPC